MCTFTCSGARFHTPPLIASTNMPTIPPKRRLPHTHPLGSFRTCALVGAYPFFLNSSSYSFLRSSCSSQGVCPRCTPFTHTSAPAGSLCTYTDCIVPFTIVPQLAIVQATIAKAKNLFIFFELSFLNSERASTPPRTCPPRPGGGLQKRSLPHSAWMRHRFRAIPTGVGKNTLRCGFKTNYCCSTERVQSTTLFPTPQ